MSHNQMSNIRNDLAVCDKMKVATQLICRKLAGDSIEARSIVDEKNISDSDLYSATIFIWNLILDEINNIDISLDEFNEDLNTLKNAIIKFEERKRMCQEHLVKLEKIGLNYVT